MHACGRMINPARGSSNACDHKRWNLVKIPTLALQPQTPDSQVAKLQPYLKGGALSFVLVSRFCAAVVDFRLVFVRVAFGGLAFPGLCRV
jgi:hypothetical protein